MPAEENANTKKCEYCDETIGKSETKCPKCGTDFEALEEDVKAIERANKVIEKRKAKDAPPEPKPTEKTKGRFGGLRNLSK